MKNRKNEHESAGQISIGTPENIIAHCMNKGFKCAGMEDFDGAYSISAVEKAVNVLERLKSGLLDKKSAVMSDFCNAFCIWYGNYIVSLFAAEWKEDFRGEQIIWLFNNWVISPFEEVFDYVYGPNKKHFLLERLNPENYKKHGLRPRNN